MKAGKTEYEVGTRIRITDCDEKDLIGLTGKLTHPFPGLMWPKVFYVAGVWLDKKGLFAGDICNLTPNDKFEVIEEEEEKREGMYLLVKGMFIDEGDVANITAAISSLIKVGIYSGEFRPDDKEHRIQWEYGLRTAEDNDPEAFEIKTWVTRDDVATVIGEDRANKMSDGMMDELARKMKNDYLNQLYWDSLKVLVTECGLAPTTKILICPACGEKDRVIEVTQQKKVLNVSLDEEGNPESEERETFDQMTYYQCEHCLHKGDDVKEFIEDEDEEV